MFWRESTYDEETLPPAFSRLLFVLKISAKFNQRDDTCSNNDIKRHREGTKARSGQCSV